MHWLDLPEGCELSQEDGRAVVDCSGSAAALTIVGTPPSTALALRVRKNVAIAIADGVHVDEDSCVEIIVVGTDSVHISIDGSVSKVRCTEQRDAGTNRPHTLALSHSADVEIDDGGWHIESGSTNEPIQIDLVVANDDRGLSISSAVPVARLRHRGTHHYELSLLSDAVFNIVEGKATLDQSIRGCRIIGTGNVAITGDLEASTVRLSGRLQVAQVLTDCDVRVQGELEVSGLVSLGDRDLLCTEAILGDSIEMNGEFTCDDLRIDGDIRGDAVFKLKSLQCSGGTAARSISAETDMTIRGPLRCEDITSRGNMSLRRVESIGSSLTWLPSDQEAFLRLAADDSEGSTERSNIPLLRVVSQSGGDTLPRLDLSHNIDIAELYVDAPAIAVTAEGTSAVHKKRDGSVSEPSVILRPRHHVTEIQLLEGRLRCVVPQNEYVALCLNPSKEAMITLAECSSSVNQLRLRGHGDVSIVDSRSGAQMGHIEAEGPVRLLSEINIDRLICRQSSGQDVPDAKLADRVPRLDLARDVEVRRASGDCVLMNIHAKIHGDTHHARSVADGFAVVEIKAVVEPDAAGTDGQLKSVDIRELSSVDLDKLAKLQVLEIARDSVKQLASERSRLRCALNQRFRPRTESNEPLEPADISQRAETAAKYAKLVDERVNSGSSRAWLHWTIAHLQYRSLRPRTAEWWFRAGYRCVGYGYRPLPALISWFAMALLVFLYALAWTPDVTFGTTMIGRFIEILFMPIGYLRLGGNNNAFSLEPGSLDISARLLIGAPFLFLILSVRQFFRSPVT